MTSYDKKYEVEPDLFGAAYPEFDRFLKKHAMRAGRALDVGCGQGRDSILLARHGYSVSGIDSSRTGVNQMLEQADMHGLNVAGIVGDIYNDLPSGDFDIIVLDSILHFQKSDAAKQRYLLERLWSKLNVEGMMVIFIHHTESKVRKLHQWAESMKDVSEEIWTEVLAYVYEEKTTGFVSESEMYMHVLRKLR